MMKPPRAAVAVLAEGSTATGLAKSSAQRLVDGFDLRMAVGGGTLLVLADPADLPWAPGVTYLGQAHGLLLPTTMTPTVRVEFFDAVVRQYVARTGGPSRHVVVLPGRVITFDLSDASADVEALRKHAVGGFM